MLRWAARWKNTKRRETNSDKHFQTWRERKKHTHTPHSHAVKCDNQKKEQQTRPPSRINGNKTATTTTTNRIRETKINKENNLQHTK